MMSKETVVRGSGNVFIDLGFDNPDEERMKAALVREIRSAIERKALTQKQAAGLLGINQPKVSELIRGRLTSVSTDRLLRFLKALDRDVDIVIKPKPRSRTHGRVRVVAEAP